MRPLKKRYSILPFQFFLFPVLIYGQANKLDSLFEKLKTAEDSTKVNVLIQLSDEYESTDLDLAFEYGQQAANLSEKIKFKNGISKSTNILGVIYEKQHKLDDAIESFRYSLSIEKEIGDKNKIADGLLDVGIIFAEKGELDSARQYMQQSIDLHQQSGNKRGQSEVLMNLGGTYEVEENWEKALDYYNQSLNLKRELKNDGEISKCLNNIGYVYYAKKDYDNALKYLQESIEAANKTKASGVLESDFQILSDIYANKKQFEKAFQYQTFYTKLKDSLLTSRNLKQLQELEAKYEAGKKEKKIELLNKEKLNQAQLVKEENKRKNIILISICIGFFLLIIFFALLFNRFRIIRHQKEIIEEKNKDITDSIKYAKRIQNSLLPTEKFIAKNLDRLKKRN